MRKREKFYFSLLVFWLLIFSTGKAEGSTSQSEFFQIGSEIQFEITKYDTAGELISQNYSNILIEEDDIYDTGSRILAWDQVLVEEKDGIRRTESHYFLTCNGLMAETDIYYYTDMYTFPKSSGRLRSTTYNLEDFNENMTEFSTYTQYTNNIEIAVSSNPARWIYYSTSATVHTEMNKIGETTIELKSHNVSTNVFEFRDIHRTRRGWYNITNRIDSFQSTIENATYWYFSEQGVDITYYEYDFTSWEENYYYWFYTWDEYEDAIGETDELTWTIYYSNELLISPLKIKDFSSGERHYRINDTNVDIEAILYPVVSEFSSIFPAAILLPVIIIIQKKK